MARKSNIQAKFRRQSFNDPQYWNMNYTEHDPKGTQVDYKVFIKAKSYEEAKHFLQKRLKEQDPPCKAKAIQGFMFHSGYRNASNVKLGIKEWEQIRSASFPNANNLLYKLEVPRDPKKTNRFNTTDYEHMKTIGFKKGKDNWSSIHKKGIILPEEKRAGMIYRGKWIKWDKDVMNSTRKSLIDALIMCDGNRTQAAKYLNMSRHKFYCLMERFPEIDWAKDYPVIRGAPSPISPEARSALSKKSMGERMALGFKPFNLSPESEAKRTANMKKALKAKKEKRWQERIPKVKDALDRHSNCRVKAAEYLDMQPATLRKFLRTTKHLVNWSEEYPSPFGHGKPYKRLFETGHLPTATIKKLNDKNGL